MAGPGSCYGVEEIKEKERFYYLLDDLVGVLNSSIVLEYKETWSKYKQDEMSLMHAFAVWSLEYLIF